MATETLNRLVAIERRVAALEDGQATMIAELEGTNARLDLVVTRLDQMVDLLRQVVVVRREFDDLEARVRQLERAR
jgi:hypothetical protein